MDSTTTVADLRTTGGRARQHRRSWLQGQSVISAASVASILGLWYVAASFLPSAVLPMPHAVAEALAVNLLDGEIFSDIWLTLVRIVFAFLIAMSVASVLGFLMGLSKRAETFFRVWVVCGITMPAVVILLLLYMIVGLNDNAAILGAAISVIPILTINIREGVKGIDLKLLGMAKAFRASKRQQIFSVIVPQVAPMLLASARFGLGLVWKMVLFAELLGRGDGIGYKIEFFYQMFNMTEVLAHALTFLIIMLFIEILVLGAIEKRAFRWREA